MTKSLSVENAAHRLVLSLRHNEEPLERYILKFIAMAGPSTQKLVYTSDVWYEYLHSQAQTWTIYRTNSLPCCLTQNLMLLISLLLKN